MEALENTEHHQHHQHHQRHSVTVDDHSLESVGGIKKIEALGSLKLLSGGSASLAAVDDLHQATGRDLNLVIGQKLNASVGRDMEERITGLRRSVAEKAWMGSEGMNALQILCDLLDLVTAMTCNWPAILMSPDRRRVRATRGPSPIMRHRPARWSVS